MSCMALPIFEQIYTTHMTAGRNMMGDTFAKCIENTAMRCTASVLPKICNETARLRQRTIVCVCVLFCFCQAMSAGRDFWVCRNFARKHSLFKNRDCIANTQFSFMYILVNKDTSKARVCIASAKTRDYMVQNYGIF